VDQRLAPVSPPTGRRYSEMTDVRRVSLPEAHRASHAAAAAWELHNAIHNP